MKLKANSFQSFSRPCAAACGRLTVLLLLFTVTGLFTLAKNGQYYPKSNPARNVSVTIKMNVVHSSAQVAEEPLQPVARFFLPQPPVPIYRVLVKESPLIVPIGVVVSTRFRSPPSYLA
jgi:hypothetical protein